MRRRIKRSPQAANFRRDGSKGVSNHENKLKVGRGNLRQGMRGRKPPVLFLFLTYRRGQKVTQVFLRGWDAALLRELTTEGGTSTLHTRLPEIGRLVRHLRKDFCLRVMDRRFRVAGQPCVRYWLLEKVVNLVEVRDDAA